MGVLACERVLVLSAFSNNVMDPETVQVTKEVVSTVVGAVVATSGVIFLPICARHHAFSIQSQIDELFSIP